MEVTHHVEQLQRQLLAASAAGGDAATEIAGRLATALDAAARLAILEALSEAAGEITQQLAPGSVDVRLRGREVEFAVSRPPADVDAPAGRSEPPPIDEGEEAGATRTTVRLPDAVKARATQAAAAEGVSLNTWLVRAIAAAAEPPSRRTTPQPKGSSYTGWMRG